MQYILFRIRNVLVDTTIARIMEPFPYLNSCKLEDV